MSITTEKIVSGTAERITTGPPRRESVLDVRGGPLDPFNFAAADRGPASLLVALLRVACGSAVGAAGHYAFESDRGQWRSMRECSPELMQNAVRRTVRAFPDWSLPSSNGDGIHAAIERFFVEAAR